MSNAILNAIAREQGKLLRQIDAVAATKVAIEVLGDSPREQAKLARQEACVKETRANIKKLQAAAGK